MRHASVQQVSGVKWRGGPGHRPIWAERGGSPWYEAIGAPAESSGSSGVVVRPKRAGEVLW